VGTGRFLAVAGVALLCGALVPAHASPPTVNEVVGENALPGSTDWQRQRGGDIEVYGTQIGALPGGEVDLHVSTAFRYRVLVYRLGWYGGAGARQVACLPTCTTDEAGVRQPPPGPPPGAAEAPITAGWPVTDVVHTDPSATSGYYLVEALLTTGPAAGKVATTFFILREAPTAHPSQVLVQVPVNTWEAYNSWGGRSLYPFTGPRMYRVSFERPFGFLAQSPFWWEIQLVRFLEREGYDVSYQTDNDTNDDPASLLRHRLVVVAGHDEYWTTNMRDAFDTAVADGTNLAFMGSNDGYWHVEYENGGQTIFGYKSLYDPNPMLAQKTAMWREIGRPECALMGVQHQFLTVQTRPLDYTVTAAGAADPWLAGTGLQTGDTISSIVGREHDVINPYPQSCFHPGLTVLFHYDGKGVDENADAVRFTAPSGARVFASGAQKLSWALDDWRPGGTISPPIAVAGDDTAPVDPRMQAFMRNALNDLTRPAPPAGLTVAQTAAGLVVSVAQSADPRNTGFVAEALTGDTWHRLCRGTVTCTGRMRTGTGVRVGLVELDQWHRRSAPAFAVLP
jgi:hypothetical protein